MMPVVSSKSQKLQDSPIPLPPQAKVLSVVPGVLVSQASGHQDSHSNKTNWTHSGTSRTPLSSLLCDNLLPSSGKKKYGKQQHWIVNTQYSGVEVKDGPPISTKPRRLRAFKITVSTLQGQKNCWFFQRRYKRNRVENRLDSKRTLMSVPAYWVLLSHVMKLSVLAHSSLKITSQLK